MKKTFLLYCFCVLCSLPDPVPAQTNDNIQVRFLNARFSHPGSSAEVMAAFQVSVNDSADFPPEIVVPPKCTVFENGREKVVLITPHTISVAIYGDDIAEKNAEAYALVRDQMKQKMLQPNFVVVYSISDIPYEFTKMSLTPAFREKRDKEKRIARREEFTLH